jgi:hypothetical protein
MDIADAMRKLEALEREHVTENSHDSGHDNWQSPKASTKLDPSVATI